MPSFIRRFHFFFLVSLFRFINALKGVDRYHPPSRATEAGSLPSPKRAARARHAHLERAQSIGQAIETPTEHPRVIFPFSTCFPYCGGIWVSAGRCSTLDIVVLLMYRLSAREMGTLHRQSSLMRRLAVRAATTRVQRIPLVLQGNRVYHTHNWKYGKSSLQQYRRVQVRAPSLLCHRWLPLGVFFEIRKNEKG